MSESTSAPQSSGPETPAGWHATEDESAHPMVAYWSGSAWKGQPVRANRAGVRPRDTMGTVGLLSILALLVLAGIGIASSNLSRAVAPGFLGAVTFVAYMVAFVNSPVPLVLGIIGVARGVRLRFLPIQSVITLAIALTATAYGVYVVIQAADQWAHLGSA